MKKTTKMPTKKIVTELDAFYTHSEKTDPKYMVADALRSAKSRLQDRGIKQVCTNAISGRDLKEKITLREVNILADEMYRDTAYRQ